MGPEKRAGGLVKAGAGNPAATDSTSAGPPAPEEPQKLNHELRLQVAERERVEQQFREILAERELAFKEIADQKFALDQHAIVATTDVEGTITYANDKFCAISKYTREELLGQNHRILKSGRHSTEFFRQMYHTIANGEVWRGEVCNRAKDGSFHWLDTSIVPFLDNGGKVRQYMAIRTDITRNRQEEEVRGRLAAAVVDSSDDAIISKDLEGTINSWNRGAEKIFGYSASDVIGKPMLMLFLPDRVNEESEILQRIRRGESVEHFETHRVRKDGKKIDVSVTISPIKDASGAIVGASKIARDITARKQDEERLAGQAEELARSNADLEQFAYVASHDLQEPLRMVTAYTQLLAERYRGKLDENADKFIGYASEGAQRMQVLIQDLLAFSRLGRNGFISVNVDCNTVIGEVLQVLAPAMQASGAVVTHGELPAVWADRTQVAQIFQNLLGNALKFRGKEAPRVAVQAERSGDRWLFSVRDNGIGIEPEYAETIFVVFQRLHARTEYPGNGIGLAICKKIIEHNGGKIWVESQVGSGSTFKFTLPCAAHHKKEDQKQKEDRKEAEKQEVHV